MTRRVFVCQDCGIEVTRWSKRCKSCAAKARFRANPRPALEALARGKVTQARQRGIEIEQSRLDVAVPIDTRAVRLCISAHAKTLRQVERECGFNRHYLSQSLRYGKMPYGNLDTLACSLGHHPCEFAYE